MTILFMYKRNVSETPLVIENNGSFVRFRFDMTFSFERAKYRTKIRRSSPLP